MKFLIVSIIALVVSNFLLRLAEESNKCEVPKEEKLFAGLGILALVIGVVTGIIGISKTL